MKALAPAALILIFFSSCRSIKPAAPDLPVSVISSTPLPDSRIDFPVTIYLASLMNDLASKFPLTFSGQGTVGPGQYRWNVQRQPFDLSLSGNLLNIADAAHFTGGGYIKNPLGGSWINVCSCDADLNIGVNASLGLAKNYSLYGNAVLTRFDLSTCSLKIAGFDLSAVIKPRAREAMENALVNLNRQLEQYNFRPLLQPVWSSINQPIKIGDTGYVSINPSAVYIGPPSGAGKLLKVDAGITARPVFYLNDPGKSPETRLPELSAAGGGGGFNLNLDVHLEYLPLNRVLNTAIAGKSIPAGAKGQITIKKAEIYGSGNNHLLIRVRFSVSQGVVPYHGVLYFTCLPRYDTATGNFYVSDIDFDVSTRQKLEEGPAGWILNSALKRYLNGEIHFNIAGQVDALKGKLNQALNRQVSPHVLLSGSVNAVNLQGILPVKDFILVRVSTSGSLAVRIN